MTKKTCFVVGPIGEPDNDIRKRADALLNHTIKETLGEGTSFDMIVDRADEMQKPGLIHGQVIERVVNADLVVADLADLKNANVMYELALRHVSRKPVVHMVLDGQKLPFDIAAQRTIHYSTTDLSIAAQAKKDLRKHVEAVLTIQKRLTTPFPPRYRCSICFRARTRSSKCRDGSCRNCPH